jgi:hypothetical protein
VDCAGARTRLRSPGDGGVERPVHLKTPGP